MGCGCNKKKSSLTTNQGTKQPERHRVSNSIEKECTIKYVDIRESDLKAVILFNETKDSIYLEINKKLREMMVSYKETCPDEQDFKVLKDFIDTKTLENAKKD